MGPDMHARRVEPDEEGLAVLDRLLDELLFGGVDFQINGWHPCLGERTGVLDLLPALAVGPRMEYTARAVFLLKLGILRVVIGFGLFLSVEVVEIAEELVEPMHRRQMLVAVAEVVLAELARRIALCLEQVGDRRRPIRNALRRTRHAYGEQPGAERVLAEDERRAPRGAALLGVGVGEQCALLRQAVNVGRFVAHDAEAVGADVMNPYVIAPDDEDVRLLLLGGRRTSDPC